MMQRFGVINGANQDSLIGRRFEQDPPLVRSALPRPANDTSHAAHVRRSPAFWETGYLVQTLRLHRQAAVKRHQVVKAVVVGRAALRTGVGRPKAGALEVDRVRLVIDSLNGEFSLTSYTLHSKIWHGATGNDLQSLPQFRGESKGQGAVRCHGRVVVT
jgi:hypothetical protein